MAKLSMVLGGIYGLLGVAAGAFGAHALRGRLDEPLLAAFQTGVQYQLVHGLALLAAGAWLPAAAGGLWVKGAVGGFGLGVLLFSGSLYLLAATGTRAWGAVTPAGGMLLLVGWVCLVVAVLRS